MRLLTASKHRLPTLSGPWLRGIPRYAILSHTWLKDQDEVTFADMSNGRGILKAGYEKIRFCNQQASKDNLAHFWVDTCCIDKANHSELSEAITSMFKWYQKASKCYVYLSDVPYNGAYAEADRSRWIRAFRESRWFTRGWTLQELLAPSCVNFYSKEGIFLGDKSTLEQDVHDITGIPIDALRGTSLTKFSTEEKLKWAVDRQTAKEEDKAYCLFGLFNVYLPLIYGEGAHAYTRLKDEIEKTSMRGRVIPFPCNISSHQPQKGSVIRKEMITQAETFLNVSMTALETKSLLIHGLPGAGKTHFARHLARNWVLGDKPAYWLDASSPESLHQSFLHFIVSAGVCSSQEASMTGVSDARMKMYSYLESSKQPWLLIFDNYDLYQSSIQFSLKGAFPERSAGSVIITSRNSGLRNILDCIKEAISVQAMNPAEAQELFCMNCDVSENSLDETSRVAINYITLDLLGNLPLAVAQAGAYVRQLIEEDVSLSNTLRQYIDEYLSSRDIVLEEVDDAFIEVYGQSIITLFSMAFSAIEKKSETASKLLLLFSFYHHRNIHSSWIKRASEEYSTLDQIDIDIESSDFSWFRRLIKPQGSGRWPTAAFKKALKLLYDYGLLDIAKDANVLTIHPLIHSWTIIFLQHQKKGSLDSFARLAAVVLCEVYDRKKDTDLRHSYFLKTELCPHAVAWFNTVKQRTHLLTSTAYSAIPGYIYHGLAGYLSSPNLPPQHLARGTVEELHLLAFRSELGQNVVCFHSLLWALKPLARWLCLRAELITKTERQQIYSLIRCLVGRLASTGVGDSFNEAKELADVYSEEMIAAKSDDQEAVSIAKVGEQYLDLHKEDFTDVDQIRMLWPFCTAIACFDADSKSRLSAFWRLLELYKRAVVVLGDTHFITVGIFASLSNAKVFNRSNGAVAATKFFPNVDWRNNTHYKIARASLIRQEIRSMTDQGHLYSTESYNLTSELHGLECEEQGEWHFDTLNTEIIVLDTLVNIRGWVGKSPFVYGTDRWFTRNDKLILPVEVGIALLVTNQHDRVKLLWPGYLSYLSLVKQSEQLVLGCQTSFQQAANVCVKHNMPEESEYFRKIAAHLETRDIRQPMSGDVTVQFVEQIYGLWQLLDKFELAIQKDDNTEKLGVLASILRHLRPENPALRESLVCLLIQYFLYLIYQDRHQLSPIITLDTLRALSTTVVDTFGDANVLNYRWKIFEALTLRQYGLADRAREVEDFLLLESGYSLDDADEDECYTDADRIRIKGGGATTWARPNSMMDVRRSRKWADSSLDMIASQYAKRGWHLAQAHFSEQRLLLHISRLNIKSDIVINLILVSVLALSRAQQWDRIWSLLESLEPKIATNSPSDQAIFVSQLVPDLVTKLLRWHYDRAVILLLDWVRYAFGIARVGFSVAAFQGLQVRWTIASFQRMAYFRLNFHYNAQQLTVEMKEIEASPEARFDEVDEKTQTKLEQILESEEHGWRNINDNRAGNG